MERAFDIANHFDEHAGFECDWSLVPDEEQQRRFLANYLGEGATDDDITALYNEIRPFSSASNLYWGLWGLLQCIFAGSDLDYAHYATSRILRSLNAEHWKLYR
ncbi:putative choline/ethanolamine kinase [Babesia divergens]|uniref:ethanolamine kinase n=1 Tax=Babesia divergens TaxID=32595 RepID=A0AAD9GC61_BABDI|nr:putative choline/ethanolamine kinase [Babesia divergens]